MRTFIADLFLGTAILYRWPAECIRPRKQMEEMLKLLNYEKLCKTFFKPWVLLLKVETKLVFMASNGNAVQLLLFIVVTNQKKKTSAESDTELVHVLAYDVVSWNDIKHLKKWN